MIIWCLVSMCSREISGPVHSRLHRMERLCGSSANLSAEAVVNNSEMRSPCLDFLRHFRKLS